MGYSSGMTVTAVRAFCIPSRKARCANANKPEEYKSKGQLRQTHFQRCCVHGFSGDIPTKEVKAFTK